MLWIVWLRERVNQQVFPLHALAIGTYSSACLSGVSKLVRPSAPSR